MNWPNKVIMHTECITLKNLAEIWDKHDACVKWCSDNLSSKGVLWECDIQRSPTNEWSFYFAQPQDAVLFRLVNGV